MANTFKIATLATGSDPDDWNDLQTILSQADIPVMPDWTFAPFSGYVELDTGGRKGTGLPKASWTWNVINAAARETLKAYCPDLSNDVYIMTRVNSTSSGIPVWGAFQAVMLWPTEEEDKDAGDVTLGLTIEFSMLIEIGEYF